MSDRAIIAVGILLAIAGAGYWYARGAGARALSQCRALQAQRSLLSIQGGDAATIARLDIAIRDCLASAKLAGADFDSSTDALKACRDKQELIEQEWIPYKNTDYADILKRGNARATILRTGAELARCYEDALAVAETVTGVDAIRAELRKSLASSVARERCYHTEARGCGRYLGSVEEAASGKVANEREQISGPLRRALVTANAKRDELKLASMPEPSMPAEGVM